MGDAADSDVRVKRWRLEKSDAAGEIFEVVEGGDDRPSVVTFRRPGEPPESYANLPYRPSEKETDQHVQDQG